MEKFPKNQIYKDKVRFLLWHVVRQLFFSSRFSDIFAIWTGSKSLLFMRIHVTAFRYGTCLGFWWHTASPWPSVGSPPLGTRSWPHTNKIRCYIMLAVDRNKNRTSRLCLLVEVIEYITATNSLVAPSSSLAVISLICTTMTLNENLKL